MTGMDALKPASSEGDRLVALTAAEDRALALLDAVEAAGLIVPGRTERELDKEIYAIAERNFGVEKHWHKRIVRAGPNTLCDFSDNPEVRTLEDDDIVFLDIGPVFTDWEADVGRSYALGPSPVKQALVRELPVQFDRVKAHFEAHPDITIELALSNRQEDLLRREADIAVRMVRPTQGALLAKRVGAVPLKLYAHRRYLAAHGTPRSLTQAGVAAIGFDRDTQMMQALAERQIHLSRDLFALRTDNDLAQLAALRAGFGVGACQAQIARRDPDLVPVLEDAFRYELEVWVAMHEDLKSSRRMRAMFDWLVAGLTEYVRS